jgi:general secretion pathway protein D
VTGVVGGTYTSADTQIQFRPVGTTLLITPNINADRTVTLRILQERSEMATEETDVLVPATGGGFAREFLPTVKSRNVSGTIVAQDGLTVAIGGLIEESVSDVRAEVPVLGKLPVIGFFFRSQNSVRSRNELVVLVRPYVFSTPAESATTSAQLMQELSIHPKANCPTGTLNAFAPHEVLRPNPPTNECQKLFQFHSVPKTF